MKTLTFHVNGMHCNSCVILIDDELSSIPNISIAKSNLHKRNVEITGDFGDKQPTEIASELSEILERHGYTLALEKQEHHKDWKSYFFAIPIAAIFIYVFVILQKSGVINIVDTSRITLGTSFLIGLIASISTCMAVVGGLLLSMSATYSKEGDKVRPQILFHVGRILSFFIFGGLIGVIGSAFTLNTPATFVLGIIIGVVMLVMGIHLLDTFHWSKKLVPSMPRFIAKHAYGISKMNHTLTPFLVGVATFFLPCGFTQAMQIYTLSTGNFVAGGINMLIFALGTFPMLALLSFSSFKINKSSTKSVFFKTVGLIVIAFAIFNIMSSLVIIGWIPPIFNF